MDDHFSASRYGQQTEAISKKSLENKIYRRHSRYYTTLILLNTGLGD